MAGATITAVDVLDRLTSDDGYRSEVDTAFEALLV